MANLLMVLETSVALCPDAEVLLTPLSAVKALP
jgi:hypothetical protein